MKKIFLALLFFPSFIFAQNVFKINGVVIGFTDGGDVKLVDTKDNTSTLANAKIINGKFTLNGSVPEPGLYMLVVEKEQPQHIYLENSNINITANKATLKDIKVTGSQSHTDFDEFRRIFNPLVGELNGAAALIAKTQPGKDWDVLKIKYDSISSLIQIQIDKYISSKPSSFVSPFLIFITEQLHDDPMLMEKRFNSLDATVKNSEIGKALSNRINIIKIGAVGSEATDFTQPDVNGQPVSLSSFRGKYVLVDFWASWCGPCRHENPNVVANYNKFKDRNFTILGVSLDRTDQKDRWLKAIEDDKLTWTNVSDLKFWENSAAVTYNVKGIPFNLLIDPKGKIVAKNLRGPNLESKLCEVLGGCN